MKKETSQKKKLFNLIVKNENNLVDEFGWITPDEFCVWILYSDIAEFINCLNAIFGIGLFDDGGISASMQDDCICFDLCELLGGYFSIEDVFPKDKYRH